MPPRRSAAAEADKKLTRTSLPSGTLPLPSSSSTPAPKPKAKRKAPLVPGRLPTLIMDNGGHTIKLLYVDHPKGESEEVKVILNAVVRAGPRGPGRKTFVGDELEKDCRDYDKAQYSLPMERGILTDWPTQKLVWDRIFGAQGLDVEFSKTRLLVTEAPFSLPNVQDAFDQMCFEEYEFAEYLRVPSALLTAFGAPPPIVGIPISKQPKRPELSEVALVIDSGHSFTHVIPVMDGQIVWASVRRLDIGGKLLTNYFKELVSFRHLYMMDQTHVVNHIKESLCYVAQDYLAELELYSNDPDPRTISYALPDFTDLSPDPTYKLGYVKDGSIPPPPVKSTPEGSEIPAEAVEEQVLELGRERCEVMEVLFRPEIVGLQQAGLHYVVKESIDSLPEELRGMFWGNLVAVGGNFKAPGMDTRLLKELRALAPDDYTVSLRRPANPITHPALSASYALTSPILHGLLDERFLSLPEYLSTGSSACRTLFGGAYAPGMGGVADDRDDPMDGGGGGGGGGGKKGRGGKKHRKTSSGEEDELGEILEGEKPEYIVRSTASRKRTG